MAKILLVGYIRELLEERRNVLYAAGYHVTLASGRDTAFQAIEQDTFDAAVLGYSVPEEERNEIARRLVRANPDTKIVMIYFTSVQNTEFADALIPTTAGAPEVLRAVNHVLKAQRSSKTG